MSDKYTALLLLNACLIILAYLFKGWMKEAWQFMWSDLDAKKEYCQKYKPFGLWRAFNRVMMTLAICKWTITCVAVDIHIAYGLITGTNPFG